MSTSTMKLRRAPSFLRQSGPRVAAQSVRVYSSGKILRIGNDLIQQLSPKQTDYLDFVPFIGNDQVLVLKLATDADKKKGSVLRTWQSSPESKSVLLSLAGLLQSLQLTEKTAPGTYKAEVLQDVDYPKEASLKISFTQKLW